MGIELDPQRLDLLSELVPRAEVIALLVNPSSPEAAPMIRDVLEVAARRGAPPRLDRSARRSTAPAARWKTASRNVNSICSLR
jgi:hypothetical protein